MTNLEKELSAQLQILRNRLADIIGICGQEGADGEPYDTIFKIAIGDYSPGRMRQEVRSIDWDVVWAEYSDWMGAEARRLKCDHCGSGGDPDWEDQMDVIERAVEAQILGVTKIKEADGEDCAIVTLEEVYEAGRPPNRRTCVRFVPTNLAISDYNISALRGALRIMLGAREESEWSKP